MKAIKLPLLGDVEEKTLNNVKTGATIVSVVVSVGSLAYAVLRARQKRKIVDNFSEDIKKTETLGQLEQVDDRVRSALQTEKIDEKEYLFLNGLIEKRFKNLTAAMQKPTSGFTTL